MNTELQQKMEKIKIVAFDIDGVMTDGNLLYLERGDEAKFFNTKDGQGITMLNEAGFKTAIITECDNVIICHRYNVLGMHSLYMEQTNKREALDKLAEEHNVTLDEIAYMGDDIPDIETLKAVGLACCPADAIEEVKEISAFVSSKKGGNGAVRELCDLFLKNKK